jgi:hypothetical protein
MPADDVRRGQQPRHDPTPRPSTPRPPNADLATDRPNQPMPANPPAGAVPVAAVGVSVLTQKQPAMPTRAATAGRASTATLAQPVHEARPPVARRTSGQDGPHGAAVRADPAARTVRATVVTAAPVADVALDALPTEPGAVAVAGQPPSDEPTRLWHPDRVSPPIRAGFAIIGVLVVCASFMMALRSPHPAPTPFSPTVATFHAPDSRLGAFWHAKTPPAGR